MLICAVKPVAVAVGVPKVGVDAALSEPAVYVLNSLEYPVRVVVMVAMDVVAAASPLTVTKPRLDTATVPPAVAVPP